MKRPPQERVSKVRGERNKTSIGEHSKIGNGLCSCMNAASRIGGPIKGKEDQELDREQMDKEVAQRSVRPTLSNAILDSNPRKTVHRKTKDRIYEIRINNQRERIAATLQDVRPGTRRD